LAAQIQDLQLQINRMIQTPGLAMLINPQEFSRSYEHTIDTPKARRGHIVHMWLEKPMSISCKGQSAAQYAMAADNTGGITHQRRIYSLSYENIMSLVMLYRNNGYVYTSATGNSDQSNSGIPVLAAGIYIYYDGHIYIGSFDDFSITDDAEKPFNLSYDFKFTVRYDIDISAVTNTVASPSTGMVPQYSGTPTVAGVNTSVQSTTPSTTPSTQSSNVPDVIT